MSTWLYSDQHLWAERGAAIDYPAENIQPLLAGGAAVAHPTRQRRGECGLDGPPDLCRRTITAPISGGRLGRLPAQRRRRSAGCHCLPSAIGRRFTKKPSCCKGAFLQESVPSCKYAPVLYGKRISQNPLLFNTFRSEIWEENCLQEGTHYQK